MRKALALAVAVFGLVIVSSACQPTEPPMTIASHPDLACDFSAVFSYTTPAKATSQMVLQHTSNGKWTDWSWYESWLTSEKAHVITAKPDSDGAYELNWTWEHSPIAKVAGTIHLRVRSNGGTVGPSFYAKRPANCL